MMMMLMLNFFYKLNITYFNVSLIIIIQNVQPKLSDREDVPTENFHFKPTNPVHTIYHNGTDFTWHPVDNLHGAPIKPAHMLRAGTGALLSESVQRLTTIIRYDRSADRLWAGMTP